MRRWAWASTSITRSSTWRPKSWQARGWDVWFYEDIPYALKPMALDARLAEFCATTRLEPVARIPAQSTWDQKIDAILRYPSQLETVFQQYVGVGTTREEINEALSAYAARSR